MADYAEYTTLGTADLDDGMKRQIGTEPQAPAAGTAVVTPSIVAVRGGGHTFILLLLPPYMGGGCFVVFGIKPTGGGGFLIIGIIYGINYGINCVYAFDNNAYRNYYRPLSR